MTNRHCRFYWTAQDNRRGRGLESQKGSYRGEYLFIHFDKWELFSGVSFRIYLVRQYLLNRLEIFIYVYFGLELNVVADVSEH